MVTIGGTVVAAGSLFTWVTQSGSRVGTAPLPGYAYDAMFPASVHICDSSRLARNAASVRYLDSVTFLIVTACKPTTARMPIEKIRMAMSASRGITPALRFGA